MNSRKLSSRRSKINPREQEILKRLRKSSTPLRKRFEEDLQFHHFSKVTAAVYLEELLRLTAHYWKSPADVTDEDLRTYFNYLQNGCRYSGSSMGITHAALTFFYSRTCSKEMPFLKIFRNRKRKTIPVVLSHEKVKQIINSVADERYRTCLTLIYSCGLRVGEAVKVEVTDIDSERGLIHIRNGKGAKDRLVPLPDNTLRILRKMWRTHQHDRLLFPAYYINLRRTPRRYGAKDKPVSNSTISLHFKAAANASGCRENPTVHSLRHSYSTRLLEENVPLFTVKEYLGHSSINSTMIYTHCTAKIRRAGMPSIEAIMGDL